MNLDEAIALLRNAVKESHLPNQKHICLSLVVAHERAEYEKALMLTRQSVAKNEITEDELKMRLGLT